MLKSLHVILELQELDMNMIRLMGLKAKRQEELANIQSIRKDLEERQLRKEHDVMELKKDMKLNEVRVREIEEEMQKLEKKTSAVKKVDEFNALTQEITTKGREKAGIERQTGELGEKLLLEEEILVSIRESLTSTTESSQALQEEIYKGISAINDEGIQILEKRNKLAENADPEILRIYERLRDNKKDSVVVPVENRGCSGCHIVVTAQHENLVRKGERLVFCEHCSRIHYWQETQEIEGAEAVTKPRRRRASA